MYSLHEFLYSLMSNCLMIQIIQPYKPVSTQLSHASLPQAWPSSTFSSLSFVSMSVNLQANIIHIYFYLLHKCHKVYSFLIFLFHVQYRVVCVCVCVCIYLHKWKILRGPIQAPPLSPHTLIQYNADLPTALHWILYHKAMCDGNFKVEDLTDNVNRFWVKVHACAIRFIYETVTLSFFVFGKWHI